MMTVKSIKATKVMGCPGSFGVVGEVVVAEDGKEVYLTYSLYDTEVYAVSNCSLYGYLAEDGAEPTDEVVTDEYVSLDAVKEETEYGAAFAMLYDIAMKVGKEI